MDPPRLFNQYELTAKLASAWEAEDDHGRLANMIHSLDVRYGLTRKVTKDRGVEEVVAQMIGRLSKAFRRLSEIEGKAILDIPCGSNTSRAPAALSFHTPLGQVKIGRPTRGYAAQFEPWFCRILTEIGARPFGVDLGDLEDETFIHYHVDLGKQGALDFLPSRSFDAVQDSRLFGSPEFTAQFPDQANRLKVAREIIRQEQRLLKPGGIVIHSDAAVLLR
jgi:hypothetical protein